jgi:hypothetical protein
MENNTDRLKADFNFLMQRLAKADDFFQKNPNKVDGYLEEYNKIIRQLSKIDKEYFKITGSEIY